MSVVFIRKNKNGMYPHIPELVQPLLIEGELEVKHL